MMRNKITRYDYTNDTGTDHPDRTAKKVRLNCGFMNVQQHEGGTSNDLSIHNRLTKLCQENIPSGPTTDTAHQSRLTQTIRELSPMETSQFPQSASHPPVISSNVNVSSLINSMILDQSYKFHVMNNAYNTIISSSLPHQRVSPVSPFKHPEPNNVSSPTQGALVSFQQQNMTTYHQGNSTQIKNFVQQRSSTLVPYMLPPSWPILPANSTTTGPNQGYSFRLTPPTNHHYHPKSEEPTIPSSLPACLAQPADRAVLSEHQQFLRFQIEVFEAGEADIGTYVRGRNKPIVLGQVGIRCRHCAPVAISHRQKGSTYFPASTIGLYQAAQNMCTAHIQCGLCPCMPEYIKEHFKTLIATKHFTSGAGKSYWAKSAQTMGLIDKEDGIFPNKTSSNSK